MHDRETVELALMALEEGWSSREAAELVGASKTAVCRWAREGAPHERRSGRIAGGRTRREEAPVNESERAAYEAAMTENMLLRAVLDDLKAAGSDPRSISRRRRVELGERLRAATGLPLREITRFLGISRSSYAYHRARLGRDRYAALRLEVRALFESMGGGRGYRPVHAELRRRGTRVSEKVVRRIMREEGLTAARRRRRAWSSYAGEPSPAPPNLPLRGDGTHRFSAPAPNLLWVTDITEFRLPSGERCYLSPVLDCFDGRPVAWSAGPRPTAELANSSLRAACATLGEGERPVVHSDRGGHYRWPGWRAVCDAHGLVRSMSRKGMSCDNARMEGFFGTLKAELWHPRDWSGWAPSDFLGELDRWMRWFREGRISQALGWLTPDEHRRALGYAV
ncbi:IS3 family transposase [Thermophilibacter provencensis]|uniref:IS3 family transposase n=1 Tax=Thermophilibacter provencensis TaxID=1852386 RepID=A0ABT7V7M9_9ACTN|nr:IS3 family transposase [Thermophilibacter provencensis]MDM8271989.1 IS3 family transposase [Thermophilibacter provencensis]